MNAVLLGGNLARDPEMRYTSGGNAVTTFTVAVNEMLGEKQVVSYLLCEAWGKNAERIAEVGRKGSRIVVEGRLKTETWDDKATGKKRYKTLVSCDMAHVLPPRPSTPDTQNVGDELDDLPF